VCVCVCVCVCVPVVPSLALTQINSNKPKVSEELDEVGPRMFMSEWFHSYHK